MKLRILNFQNMKKALRYSVTSELLKFENRTSVISKISRFSVHRHPGINEGVFGKGLLSLIFRNKKSSVGQFLPRPGPQGASVLSVWIFDYLLMYLNEQFGNFTLAKNKSCNLHSYENLNANTS